MGLLTERALASFVGEDAVAHFAGAGTPDADAGGPIVIVLIAVRDVRVLPDGRVGAVVEWGRERADRPGADAVVDEADFRLWTEVEGRWLLDDEIGSFTPWYQAEGTPPVWQAGATPDASSSDRSQPDRAIWFGASWHIPCAAERRGHTASGTRRRNDDG